MTVTELSPARAYKVTGVRVLRAEWAKFWSLRSSWVILAIAVVLLIALGAIASATYSPGTVGQDGPPGPGSGSGEQDAVSLALLGVTFASLAVGVLGVLLSAGEYTTGMIRSTLTAVPRRLPVLWSKAAVVGPVFLVLTTHGALAAFQPGGLGRKANETHQTLDAYQLLDVIRPAPGPAWLRGWVGEAGGRGAPTWGTGRHGG
ncbi:hypothetical protein ACIRG4_33285 [Streptomyces sp. NPDC102395]|uniref:hypothetical protein n=1 Tax=Streptomyces sp. NPDC102395 TaxID=3366168 RepID=UPI0037FF39DB